MAVSSVAGAMIGRVPPHPSLSTASLNSGPQDGMPVDGGVFCQCLQDGMPVDGGVFCGRGDERSCANAPLTLYSLNRYNAELILSKS